MHDELEREREERLLKFAALAGQEREDQEYEAFLRSDEYVPPDEAWMKKVTSELRRPPNRRLVHWRKLVVMAAAIVVLLCAGVGTAIANPKALANLFSQDYDRYSQVRVDDGVVLEKPEGWESEYYPTWAPKGFHIEEISQTDSLQAITLLNSATNKKIWFYVAENEKDAYPNTEELEETEITVFGEKKKAYISEDGKTRQTVIKLDKGSVMVSGELTKEELEVMIENIKNLR
ncbi:DUF4367 domain-containing protein [Allofournierella sp.]|uniref:DUF4367 domain-containing protein n=2 Tax=Allofournierella sp. TaxID=1940256 RepID=UPI003AB76C2D